MKIKYITINIINAFIIIILLFQILFSNSKRAKINPIINNEKNIINDYPREDDFFDDDIFEKCEQLKERQKQLQNDITTLIKKSQDNKLKIEVNKIYIKVLYILIFILLFIFIMIIIFKFYLQCHKKKESNLFFNLKEKYNEHIIEK